MIKQLSVAIGIFTSLFLIIWVANFSEPDTMIFQIV